MAESAAISTTIEKTNRMLKEVGQAMGWENQPDRTLTAVRVTLHAFRDRLPVQEAVNFGAQLPELLRGIYYEGWSPSRVPMKMNRQELLDRIRGELAYEADIPLLINSVLGTVAMHIAPGEIEKLKGALPDEIARMLPEAA